MSTEPESDTITFDEVLKVRMRVGKVVEASDHPNADKLVVMKVDLGGEQRQLVAGLKGYYTPDQLVGRNLIVVTNLVGERRRAASASTT